MYVYCLLRAHCLQQLYHMLSTLLSGETEPTWQVCTRACTFGMLKQCGCIVVNQRQESLIANSNLWLLWKCELLLLFKQDS